MLLFHTEPDVSSGRSEMPSDPKATRPLCPSLQCGNSFCKTEWQHIEMAEPRAQGHDACVSENVQHRAAQAGLFRRGCSWHEKLPGMGNHRNSAPYQAINTASARPGSPALVFTHVLCVLVMYRMLLSASV